MLTEIGKNLNMFSDEAVDTEFITEKRYVSLIIDFFGKHVSFHEQEDGTVSCRLKVSEMAMKHWAVEHANIVKVISPESLVEEIKDEIRKANTLYGTADRRSWILGMITAFSECVAGGCKRLALSPPLRPGDFELVAKEAYEIIEKHGLLHYREENPDRPEEGRFEWILITGKQETIDQYLELRARGYSPAVSLEPFYELLSYNPEESIYTGYDAFRSWFPE